MITRTADQFDARPTRLAAETGYGSAEMLTWLVYERKIDALSGRIPVHLNRICCRSVMMISGRPL